MIITIVKFTAFNSEGEKSFIDKTDEEIKAEMLELCNTINETERRVYDATEITNAESH